MKKIFKGWTIFELILLFVSPIIVVTIGIVYNSDILTIVSSAVGVVGVLCMAKGLIIGQFIGLTSAVLYSIVSYQNHFYGEMIIYLGLSLPMHIWGIIEWLKHKNKETKIVEVNKIKLKEWVCVIIVAAGIFVGFYFLLKAFNTKELIVSTLSVVDNIFGVYLLARRSKYGFLSYIVNDIILIVLWGIPVFSGSLALLAMLLNPVLNLVNDCYGIINWSKMQKQQKKKDNFLRFLLPVDRCLTLRN